MLFDHCLFFEYFDLIKVLVFLKKYTTTSPTKRGNKNFIAFHIREFKFRKFLTIFLKKYIGVGWNRTNSDRSIDLQSTVIPLDYYP